MCMDQIDRVLAQVVVHRANGFTERQQSALEWNLHIWKRHRVKEPLPRPRVTCDRDLVAQLVHREREIGDVAREPAGVGAEGEVENAKRLIAHSVNGKCQSAKGAKKEENELSISFLGPSWRPWRLIRINTATLD